MTQKLENLSSTQDGYECESIYIWTSVITVLYFWELSLGFGSWKLWWIIQSGRFVVHTLRFEIQHLFHNHWWFVLWNQSDFWWKIQSNQGLAKPQWFQIHLLHGWIVFWVWKKLGLRFQSNRVLAKAMEKRQRFQILPLLRSQHSPKRSHFGPYWFSNRLISLLLWFFI